MNRHRYAGYNRRSRGRRGGQGLDLREIVHLIWSLQMLFGSRRGGTGFLVLAIAAVFVGYLIYQGYQTWMRADPNQALAAADTLWDRDERVEAVREYKELLRKKDPVDPEYAWLQDSRPRLYRRIITFEAEYGDLANARDWINDAWNEGHHDLRFDSQEARRLWDEETAGKRSGSVNSQNPNSDRGPLDDLIPDNLRQ